VGHKEEKTHQLKPGSSALNVSNNEVVAVCGAGAAGMAAALSAARAGADVVLIEAGRRLGGTVTHALIHTLGGFFDSDGEFLNDGLARALVHSLLDADANTHRRRMGRTWVLAVSPSVYGSVAESWIASEQRIKILDAARVSNVRLEADRIRAIEVSHSQGTLHLCTRTVIDATGTAAVIRLILPNGVDDDERRAAAGLVFILRGVRTGALDFPKGVRALRMLRSAAEDGTLPPSCGKAWLDKGLYDDEVYVKLFVALLDDWQRRENRGEITDEALSTQTAVVSFLRRIPDFTEAYVANQGRLGIRDGGRVRGEYCLTVADVREGRKFADAACRCAWPIEYWDPVSGLSLEYLPDRSYYEIPLAALRVKGFQNLWAAGKCLSADRYAQASARVVGSCWSMGEAVGKAVAASWEPRHE
jgi:ribulose 1,5-bisphosphate synthetase/thiazole synthase